MHEPVVWVGFSQWQMNAKLYMIELKGIYYNKIQPDPMAVLVQYDGRLLHVWHLTDPFYRLRSGSRFAIKALPHADNRVILFSDGARIETDNTDALNTLIEGLDSLKSLKTLFASKFFLILGLIIFISALAYGAWILM